MRTTALVAVFLGAAGSFILVLYNGRNNKSILLNALFVTWVLSPFIGLFFADKVSKQWTDITRKTLYVLMLILTVIFLLSYSGMLNPVGAKTAFVFLVIPLISWVLILILIVIAKWQSK